MDRMILDRFKIPVVAIFATALVACGGGGGDDGVVDSSADRPDSIEISVDTSISLANDSLPGFDGRERPLGAVETATGEQSVFVTDELWLATDDTEELDSLLQRWNGEVIQSIDMRATGIDLPAQHLIRVDTTLIDSSALVPDINQLNGAGGGAFRVSSDQGLRLLSAGVTEKLADRPVGLNWVGVGQSLESGFTTEAPTGNALRADFPYTPNAAQWPTHNLDDNQSIGVVKAWEALARAGKLSNKVRIAVVDQGFYVNEDLATDFMAVSLIPFQDAIGSENLFNCGGGNPCPWHGTLVASAAMAIPDNSYGAAGPAGPVAQPILIHATGDMFMSIQALVSARAREARIVNMSYGIPVPWPLVFSLAPFEAATFAARQSGMLLFAAAGNSNSNVDVNETAFGVSVGFEETWHTPCENAGVICVGGVAVNSMAKAAGSSYGAEQVDIFAPYRLWLGPDPDNPNNTARAKQGTSFSSPFVAGVAALIWSADPGLSANEVEDILLSTAHPSSEDKVNRVVNAAGAVQAALGNVAPNLDVRAPVADQRLEVNLAYRFAADVDDFEDGRNCCDISWSSNVDGDLGTGRVINPSFSTLGVRTLRVSTEDSEGARGDVQRVFEVVNSPPTASITAPAAGATVFRSTLTTLKGSANDINESGGLLACGLLRWTSNVASDVGLLGVGCEISVSFTTLGSRTLTLEATDPQGGSDQASVVINVVETPVNLPPVVRITQPGNRQVVGISELLTLTATAEDPESDPINSITWRVQVNGGAQVTIGQGAALDWRPSDSIDFSNEGTYVASISVRASDSNGNEGEDRVTLKEWIIIN